MNSIISPKTGLFVEQMYTGCLAEAAYYVESNGEVAIIDPMRETAPYVAKAAERGAKIKYIFETHFHADFVSGHVDLAKRTGAEIIYGPTAETAYDTIQAVDGQEFILGDVKFKVLHTPGHTPESSSYLLFDEEGKEYAVFTGDTLFIGEVGRPDLAQKSGEITERDLAGWLYDSLRNKLMVLPDHVIVYPAHGAGSACGKNISKERWSTIGQQKQTNYALQPMEKEAFIDVVTEGIMPPPQYFGKNAALNKLGYHDIDELLKNNTRSIGLSELDEAVENGAIILDTRHKDAFCEAHIPGSMFIGLDGSFAPWVGTLIEDLGQAIVLIADKGREEEAVLRLARVGYHNALGYLKGGLDTWKSAGRETAEIPCISAAAFTKLHQEGKAIVIDSRKPGEYESEHITGAVSYPLDFIHSHLNELDKSGTQYLHCASGYRSVIACSILQGQGYNNIVNVLDGIKGSIQAGIKTETKACANS